MGPHSELRSGAERRNPALLAWLATFAIAFGYIEGAVAHYLRMHLYPDGFGNSISLIVDDHTLLVEAGRELCTLLVLASVAALTRGPAARRLASFVYSFAIWDLSYYAALWLFEGWPGSPTDWDLLFVVPVPWFAPVLAPMMISAMGIIGAVSTHAILDRRGELLVDWHAITLVNAALVVWEISFMAHDGPPTMFPTRYRWWLLFVGMALAWAGYLLTWRKNATLRWCRGADDAAPKRF